MFRRIWLGSEISESPLAASAMIIPIDSLPFRNYSAVRVILFVFYGRSFQLFIIAAKIERRNCVYP